MADLNETALNCTEQSVDRLWSSENECGDMPIAFTVLLMVAGCWGGFFVLSGGRLIYLGRASYGDTTVAKKMQFLQAWFYSFGHTMVSLAVVFSVGSLVADSEFISAIVVLGLYAFSVSFMSMIDVIGTDGKQQGINGIDFRVMIQYFFTVYLPKSVWKLTGHKETGLGFDEEPRKLSYIEKFFCMEAVYNNHSPRVYDLKDVFAIQGAFLSLPTLFTLLLTVVRSNGIASEEHQNVTVVEVFDEYRFDPLISFTAVLTFASAVMAPVLGDWESYKKNIVYCIGSVVLRTLEVVARFGVYTFFLDYSKFSAFIMLGAEFTFMWLTGIYTANPSSAGRTGTVSHKLLASWESVFFTNYRRIHVDKELLQDNLSLMPTTIEFLRFIVRTTTTLVGYLIMGVGNMPKSYTTDVDDMKALPTLFFAGIIANAAVILFGLVNFLIVNKKSLKKSDLSMLAGYWSSFKPCRILIPSGAFHANRDNINFQAGGEPIHYL